MTQQLKNSFPVGTRVLVWVSECRRIEGEVAYIRWGSLFPYEVLLPDRSLFRCSGDDLELLRAEAPEMITMSTEAFVGFLALAAQQGYDHTSFEPRFIAEDKADRIFEKHVVPFLATQETPERIIDCE